MMTLTNSVGASSFSQQPWDEIPWQKCYRKTKRLQTRIVKTIKEGNEYVFTRETNKRVYDIDRRDFKRACEMSGIENFHFHDLRHTWASWHVQAGTPLFTLKELGGWETLEMVKKYAHLNAEHLSKFSNMVSLWPHREKKDNYKRRLSILND